MNLHLTAQEQAFQVAAQEFLTAHWDSSALLLPGPRQRAAELRYFEALATHGWLVGQWARADGGAGWSERERWLWECAAAACGAPQPSIHGPDLLAPLLLRVGTAEQRRAHLPAIANGRVRWCQALAEDSGVLDTATLDTVTISTHAIPSDTGWVLSGEKPWVLDAVGPGGHATPRGEGDSVHLKGQISDQIWGQIWFYVLARVPSASESEPALGLFLVSADAQGVNVVPRPMIGDTADQPMVAAVSFAEVALPPAALLGKAGAGADYAGELAERELALPGSVARNALLYQRLRDFVASGEWDGGSLWADPDYVAKLHGVEVQLEALKALEARAFAPAAAREARGSRGAVVGPEGPEFRQAARLALASRSSELSQTLADLQVEALGYFALPMVDFSALDNEGAIGPEFAQPVLLGMLSDRARGAIGAPREHLKNIIAKSVLGLPRGSRAADNSNQQNNQTKTTKQK